MELENFQERMSRILLFAPLYRLQRRRIKRKDGTEISLMELGLMSLLFFFEKMLSGRRDAGIHELALFLQDQTHGSLFDTVSGYEKTARDIVTTFRPSTGRRNEEPFFDWSAGKNASIQFSYLKADKVDISSNTQYYVLDEQGLELVFATKEYFNEYQLSINQLILRKQLEKGQFILALHQIEEMRLNVETLHDRMRRIRQEIHRSIVSKATLERYQKIVKDLNERLESEEEQFKELKTFIAETKDRIRANVNNDPERVAYTSILDVERHLDAVHGAHRNLLQFGIELGTSALTAAEEALYFSRVDSFNFENDITSRFLATPLPLTSSRRLIDPFLPIAKAVIWSPLDVFAPQRLERLEREKRQEDFPDTEESDDESEEAKANIRYHYNIIVTNLLTFLQYNEETDLRSFLAYLQDRRSPYASEKQFYIFWMLLHRRGEIRFDGSEWYNDSPYRDIAARHPELVSITVTERSDRIETDDYTISNMNIKVVTNHGI